MKKEVFLFTDGACRGNPGPGGWGALLRTGTYEKHLKGSEPDTTNNRMELTAALRALEALTQPCRVVLTTDSRYVMQGLTDWMPRWKKNGWKTAGREPVKNRDLWQALDAAVQRHEVRWEWVKGHNGHPENEQADRLANEAIDDMLGKRGRT